MEYEYYGDIDHLMHSAKAYMYIILLLFIHNSLAKPAGTGLPNLEVAYYTCTIIDDASHLDVKDRVINAECHAKQQLNRLV